MIRSRNPNAKYVPFGVKFQILVNGKQLVKPTAIVEDCNLPRFKGDNYRVLRVSFRSTDTRDKFSIYASRIGENVEHDYFPRRHPQTIELCRYEEREEGWSNLIEVIGCTV